MNCKYLKESKFLYDNQLQVCVVDQLQRMHLFYCLPLSMAPQIRVILTDRLIDRSIDQRID